MTPESNPSPEDLASTVLLRFDEDKDAVHQQIEAEALLVNSIPRNGEVVNIEHQYHAVKQVVHNYDADGIEVHLGPSGETPEEAREKVETPKAG